MKKQNIISIIVCIAALAICLLSLWTRYNVNSIGQSFVALDTSTAVWDESAQSWVIQNIALPPNSWPEWTTVEASALYSMGRGLSVWESSRLDGKLTATVPPRGNMSYYHPIAEENTPQKVTLLFRTSDNTDPRNNDRQYFIASQTVVRYRWILGVFMLSLGAAGGIFHIFNLHHSLTAKKYLFQRLGYFASISEQKPSQSNNEISADEITWHQGVEYFGNAKNILLTVSLVVVATTYMLATFPGSRGYHGSLAEAFLHKQTYLPIQPNPKLATLKDPYDPAQNSPIRQEGGVLHDASYFNGRFYLYWGPVPAFFYMALSGLTDSSAVCFFAYGAFVFQLLFVLKIVRLPPNQWGNFSFVACVLLLAYANARFFVLQRPEVYEVACTAGNFFFSMALFFLAQFIQRDGSFSYAFSLGMALGLASGSRLSLSLAAAVQLAVIGLYLLLRSATFSGVYRSTLLFVTMAVPFSVCIAALLCYNYIRFDSFFNFGYSYVLAGVHPRLFAQGYPSGTKISGFLQGLYVYFWQPPKFIENFPFVARSVYLANPIPAFYSGMSCGFLFNPALFGCFLNVFSCFFCTNSNHKERQKNNLVIIVLASAGLSSIFVLANLPAWTPAYPSDFEVTLLPLAIMGWISLFSFIRNYHKKNNTRTMCVVSSFSYFIFFIVCIWSIWAGGICNYFYGYWGT